MKIKGYELTYTNSKAEDPLEILVDNYIYETKSDAEFAAEEYGFTIIDIEYVEFDDE